MTDPVFPFDAWNFDTDDLGDWNAVCPNCETYDDVWKDYRHYINGSKTRLECEACGATSEWFV